MKKIALTAFVAACFAVPGIAMADDFVSACVASSMGLPDADKICKCTSDKVTGADRSNAISIMKATTEAMQKGTMFDASKLTADKQQSLLVVASAQASCLSVK
ncbi:MAG TPA: hypothetical protein VK196_05855 [Magnetospirillum sp.]|nr:hypothetical protein [Magnetospirillum sp.]